VDVCTRCPWGRGIRRGVRDRRRRERVRLGIVRAAGCVDRGVCAGVVGVVPVVVRVVVVSFWTAGVRSLSAAG
jgi:hypothetical protein